VLEFSKSFIRQKPNTGSLHGYIHWVPAILMESLNPRP